jgi:arylsulfatase A-like enzyme
MISHMDEGLGRVLQALRDSPYADNTVIIFTSDNGLSLGEHGLMGKQNLYQASLRVPLVMSGPGIPAGQTREAFVYLMDLYPTICELARVRVPAGVDGRSLAALLRSGSAGARTSIYFAFLNCQRAVRDRRYKLIEYLVNGVRTTQLFDLVADPGETTNLAGRPGYADDLSRLRNELLIWQRRVRDHLVLA